MSERQRIRWVKLWVGELADPTFRSWTVAQRYCWFTVQLIAAQAATPGHLTDSSGECFSIADLSRLLDVAWHTARDFVEEAVAAGKLIRGTNGALRVAQWDERQRSQVGALVARSLQQARTEYDVSASPPLQEERARGSAQRSEADDLKALPSAEARDAGSQLPISMNRIEELCDSLRGADRGSPRALASVLRGMSEYELAMGLERLRSRLDVRNEAAYLVRTLKRIKDERAERAAA